MKKATTPLLSIAGYEASGQMGVLADMSVFESFGFEAISVRTATTEQIGAEFSLVATSQPAFSDALHELPTVEYAKIGMIPTPALVSELAEWLERRPNVRVVHDPVRYSSTGLVLASEASFSAQRSRLLPLVHVLTPNAGEAAALAGLPVPTNTTEAVMVAAGLFGRMREDAIVVITGVTSENAVVDVAMTKAGVEFVECARIDGEKRGTGCRYSSALLCALAEEMSIMKALRRAQGMVVAYLRA